MIINIKMIEYEIKNIKRLENIGIPQRKEKRK